MSRWLLSGHNPRESFGISYPLSTSYHAEFARRQLAYVVSPLVGGTHLLDMTLPTMVAVQGQLYINISCLARNVALAVPFDPTSFGAPRGLLEVKHQPNLSTRLLLPVRFGRVYRQTMRTYREVIPLYKSTMLEVYWRMRACNPNHLTEEDLAQIHRLFDAAMLEQVTAYANTIMFVAMLNVGVVGGVTEKAPALLNLLVGRDTATAQMGERMWELREVAVQCGNEVVALLRTGEKGLAEFREILAAAPLLEAVEHFLRTYGHRAFRYASEFESTRLADQPKLVLLTIGGLLEESEPPAVRAEAARKASRQALQGMNPLQRLLWASLLRWGSGLVEKREEIRDIMELQSAAYGLAARLLSRHYFPGQSDDTLWLYTFDELLLFGQTHGQKRVDPAEIEKRRVALEQYRRQGLLPELVWYDPETGAWSPVVEEREERERPASGLGACLQGIGASAGSCPVEGIALVTDNAAEAAQRLLQLSGPVVLVTPLTDPVWSSIFRRLAAVVTEMGGVMSHAAIVARENGIPAVVGVPEASHRIRDGQWVRVDAAAGTVEVLQEARQDQPVEAVYGS